MMSFVQGTLLLLGMFFPGWVLARLLQRCFHDPLSFGEHLSAAVLLSSVLISGPMTVFGILQLPLLAGYSLVYEGFAISASAVWLITNRRTLIYHLRKRLSPQSWDLLDVALFSVTLGLIVYVIIHPLDEWDAVQVYLPDALAVVRSNFFPIINPITKVSFGYSPFAAVLYAWGIMATNTIATGNWYDQLRFLPLVYVSGTASLLYQFSSKCGIAKNTRRIALLFFLSSPLMLAIINYFLYNVELYFMFFSFGSVAWLLLSDDRSPRSLPFLFSGISAGMATFVKPLGILIPLLWLMTYFLLSKRRTAFRSLLATSAILIVSAIPLHAGNPPAIEILTSTSLILVCVFILQRLQDTGKSLLNWKYLIPTTLIAFSGVIWIARNYVIFGSPFAGLIITNYGTSNIAWANSILFKIGIPQVLNGEDHLGPWSAFTIFAEVLMLPTLLIFRLVGLFKSYVYRPMGILTVWTLVYVVMWTLEASHVSIRELPTILPAVATLDALGIAVVLQKAIRTSVSAKLLTSYALIALILSVWYIEGAMRVFGGRVFLPYSQYIQSQVFSDIVYTAAVIILLMLMAGFLAVSLSRLSKRVVFVLRNVAPSLLVGFLILTLLASPAFLLANFGSFGAYDSYSVDNAQYRELSVLRAALGGLPPDTSIVSFGSWGIPLYTGYSVYNLNDIRTLADFRDLLTSNNASYILQRFHALNVMLALFPANSTNPTFPAFWNLKYELSSLAMLLFDNHYAFQNISRGDWSVLRITSATRFSGFVDVILRDGNLTIGSAFARNYQPSTRFGPNVTVSIAADFSGLVSQQVIAGNLVQVTVSVNATPVGYSSANMQWYPIGGWPYWKVYSGDVLGMSGFYSFPVGSILEGISSYGGFTSYGLNINSINATVLVNGSPVTSQLARPLGYYVLQWFPTLSYGTLGNLNDWTY